MYASESQSIGAAVTTIPGAGWLTQQNIYFSPGPRNERALWGLFHMGAKAIHETVLS